MALDELVGGLSEPLRVELEDDVVPLHEVVSDTVSNRAVHVVLAVLGLQRALDGLSEPSPQGMLLAVSVSRSFAFWCTVSESRPSLIL